MPKRKFQIYLAGPIHGCNDAQIRLWRDSVKRKYGAQCEFLDPSENLLNREASPAEVVEADIRAIESADGLLVNMWRESIGAALGVVHAHRRGQPVVVSDPNHLQNRILTFYADAVTESPLKGAKALLDLLGAESNWSIIKSRQREKPFDRHTLMAAIQGACRDARRDDVVMPRLVLPEVIERLRKSDRRMRRQLTTATIDETVREVLSELEADPVHGEMAVGILDAWRRRVTDRRSLRSPFDDANLHGDGDGGTGVAKPRLEFGVERLLRETSVPVSCGGKSHATIWGTTVKRLDDIPSADARSVLSSIASVPGITAIVLGPFGRKESRNTSGAMVAVSPTPFVIEGKLFDRGVKGTMQSFQVRVQSDDAKETVASAIETELRSTERWTGR